MSKLLILAAFWSQSVLSQTLPIYEKGSGSRFELKWGTQSMEIFVYISNSSPSDLTFETDAKVVFGPIVKEMWQQYSLKPNGKRLGLTKGYILSSDWSTPQELTPEYLKGYDGVQMDQFLFGDAKSLKGVKVGRDKLTVPAGEVEADHYRLSQNGQVVDFWISDKVKPIGLVKLVSSGPRMEQNYNLVLGALIKNKPSRINPAKAIPLNEEGRSLLPLLGPAIGFKN